MQTNERRTKKAPSPPRTPRISAAAAAALLHKMSATSCLLPVQPQKSALGAVGLDGWYNNRMCNSSNEYTGLLLCREHELQLSCTVQGPLSLSLRCLKGLQMPSSLSPPLSLTKLVRHAACRHSLMYIFPSLARPPALRVAECEGESSINDVSLE